MVGQGWHHHLGQVVPGLCDVEGGAQPHTGGTEQLQSLGRPAAHLAPRLVLGDVRDEQADAQVGAVGPVQPVGGGLPHVLPLRVSARATAHPQPADRAPVDQHAGEHLLEGGRDRTGEGLADPPAQQLSAGQPVDGEGGVVDGDVAQLGVADGQPHGGPGDQRLGQGPVGQAPVGQGTVGQGTVAGQAGWRLVPAHRGRLPPRRGTGRGEAVTKVTRHAVTRTR